MSQLAQLLSYSSLPVFFEQISLLQRRLHGNRAEISYWVESEASERLMRSIDHAIYGVLEGTEKEEWLLPPAKWLGLLELLAEIEKDGGDTVLICVRNAQSVVDLHSFLEIPDAYMHVMLQRILLRLFPNASPDSREGRLLALLHAQIADAMRSVRSAGLLQCSLGHVREQLRIHESLFEVKNRRDFRSLLSRRFFASANLPDADGGTAVIRPVLSGTTIARSGGGRERNAREGGRIVPLPPSWREAAQTVLLQLRRTGAAELRERPAARDGRVRAVGRGARSCHHRISNDGAEFPPNDVSRPQ